MAIRCPRGRHPLNCTYLFTSRQPAGAVKALTAEKMNECVWRKVEGVALGAADTNGISHGQMKGSARCLDQNSLESFSSAVEFPSMQHRHFCLYRLYVGAFLLAATGAAADFLSGQAL